ncbi:MAG: GNAT family N-acetyltransferase [Planctomycetota bacterium]
MSLPVTIRADDLSGEEIAAFVGKHLVEVSQDSPPESVHALDLDGLRGADVSFWSAWQGATLVGCVALKELAADHGELKSMRTAPPYRRQGVGAQLLAHIVSVAKARGYRRLSLETGSMNAFAPSRALYARFGFESCGPFAQYVEDQYSVFMRRDLTE